MSTVQLDILRGTKADTERKRAHSHNFDHSILYTYSILFLDIVVNLLLGLTYKLNFIINLVSDITGGLETYPHG